VRVALLDPSGRSYPDPASDSDFTMLELRRPPRLRVQRYYEDNLELVPSVVWKLARGRFDVAHAFAPALGWGASQAQRFGGPPFVYSFSGPLTRDWLVDRHYRLEMMVATASVAKVCTVEDEATATVFERFLLRRPEVVDPSGAPGRYERFYS
jgi:hypothetical protein